MKSNIEMKMELMERRQAVHANKIQATNADDNCDADSRKREEPKDIKSCSS